MFCLVIETVFLVIETRSPNPVIEADVQLSRRSVIEVLLQFELAHLQKTSLGIWRILFWCDSHKYPAQITQGQMHYEA